jgi:protein SCO1
MAALKIIMSNPKRRILRSITNMRIKALRNFWICAAMLILSSRVFAATPEEMIGGIGFDQKLNAQIPLELKFFDESAEPVPLQRYFQQKPVILVLVYYGCPMLCTQTLNGFAKSIRTTTLQPGGDFEIVAVSFDPKETPALAAEKKRKYLHSFGLNGTASGWHFLTGNASEIAALTDAAGFRYSCDPDTGQYAHASGIMVLTPQGRISRYFFGIEFSPRDLRLGLVEASANKIGSLVDQVLLYCYLYDPKAGAYGLVIMKIVRIGGVITVFCLATFIFLMLRRDAKRPSADAAQEAPRSC